MCRGDEQKTFKEKTPSSVRTCWLHENEPWSISTRSMQWGERSLTAQSGSSAEEEQDCSPPTLPSCCCFLLSRTGMPHPLRLVGDYSTHNPCWGCFLNRLEKRLFLIWKQQNIFHKTWFKMTMENSTIKNRIKNLLRSPSIKLRRNKPRGSKENLGNKVCNLILDLETSLCCSVNFSSSL